MSSPPAEVEYGDYFDSGGDVNTLVKRYYGKKLDNTTVDSQIEHLRIAMKAPTDDVVFAWSTLVKNETAEAIYNDWYTFHRDMVFSHDVRQYIEDELMRIRTQSIDNETETTDEDKEFFLEELESDRSRFETNQTEFLQEQLTQIPDIKSNEGYQKAWLDRFELSARVLGRKVGAQVQTYNQLVHTYTDLLQSNATHSSHSQASGPRRVPLLESEHVIETKAERLDAALFQTWTLISNLFDAICEFGVERPAVFSKSEYEDRFETLYQFSAKQLEHARQLRANALQVTELVESEQTEERRQFDDLRSGVDFRSALEQIINTAKENERKQLINTAKENERKHSENIDDTLDQIHSIVKKWEASEFLAQNTGNSAPPILS